MAALPCSTSRLICIAWDYASTIRSSSPIVESGWLENVETKRRCGRDGVYGIFHLSGPDFSMGKLTKEAETRMGTRGGSELACTCRMGRDTCPC